MYKENERILLLRNSLYEKLVNNIKNLRLNGNLENRLSCNLNIAIPGIKSLDLINNLKRVIVSTGSACNSKDIENSYVLSAMGISNDIINSSVRLALGRYTCKKDIEEIVGDFRNTVNKLQND